VVDADREAAIRRAEGEFKFRIEARKRRHIETLRGPEDEGFLTGWTELTAVWPQEPRLPFAEGVMNFGDAAVEPSVLVD
jgi:hypothetical protein